MIKILDPIELDLDLNFKITRDFGLNNFDQCLIGHLPRHV